ncbi:MAG: cytochrome c biogenesis protein CcdA [Defluviitaleaceae bacterium]|nr:cytochrome c biogenesis protein CcdA [Defluviitaleaceae bacterium]
MQYALLFLEGIITFISPCLLPMLPVYVSYFAGGEAEKSGGKASLRNAAGFVLGFTIVFVALGAFAGSIGGLLLDYSTAVNIITGLVVVMFGLNYLGFLPASRFRFTLMPARKKLKTIGTAAKTLTFPSAFLFGIVFSIGWTPCISAFLGAALLRASQQGHMAEGMFMLFVFSMGLGLPFIASAVLIHRLKNAFDFIKKHYRIINCLSGGLLVLVGILMMTGIFGRFMALFA